MFNVKDLEQGVLSSLLISVITSFVIALQYRNRALNMKGTVIVQIFAVYYCSRFSQSV